MIRKWENNMWCVPGETVQDCFKNLISEVNGPDGLKDIKCNKLVSKNGPFQGKFSCGSDNVVDIINSAQRKNLIKPDNITILEKVIDFLKDKSITRQKQVKQ